jgi:hypothetical protein
MMGTINTCREKLWQSNMHYDGIQTLRVWVNLSDATVGDAVEARLSDPTAVPYATVLDMRTTSSSTNPSSHSLSYATSTPATATALSLSLSVSTSGGTSAHQDSPPVTVIPRKYTIGYYKDELRRRVEQSSMVTSSTDLSLVLWKFQCPHLAPGQPLTTLARYLVPVPCRRFVFSSPPSFGLGFCSLGMGSGVGLGLRHDDVEDAWQVNAIVSGRVVTVIRTTKRLLFQADEHSLSVNTTTSMALERAMSATSSVDGGDGHSVMNDSLSALSSVGRVSPDRSQRDHTTTTAEKQAGGVKTKKTQDPSVSLTSSPTSAMKGIQRSTSRETTVLTPVVYKDDDVESTTSRALYVYDPVKASLASTPSGSANNSVTDQSSRVSTVVKHVPTFAAAVTVIGDGGSGKVGRGGLTSTVEVADAPQQELPFMPVIGSVVKPHRTVELMSKRAPASLGYSWSVLDSWVLGDRGLADLPNRPVSPSRRPLLEPQYATMVAVKLSEKLMELDVDMNDPAYSGGGAAGAAPKSPIAKRRATVAGEQLLVSRDGRERVIVNGIRMLVRPKDPEEVKKATTLEVSKTYGAYCDRVFQFHS